MTQQAKFDREKQIAKAGLCKTKTTKMSTSSLSPRCMTLLSKLPLLSSSSSRVSLQLLVPENLKVLSFSFCPLTFCFPFFFASASILSFYVALSFNFKRCNLQCEAHTDSLHKQRLWFKCCCPQQSPSLSNAANTLSLSLIVGVKYDWV